MLNNDNVARILVTGTEGDLVDLNDCAVNMVRDYCREQGYNAVALVREEKARIDAGHLNLAAYMKAKRTGSRMLLQRKVRRAVWTVIETRRVLRPASEL
jgi:hypothetical protein